MNISYEIPVYQLGKIPVKLKFSCIKYINIKLFFCNITYHFKVNLFDYLFYRDFLVITLTHCNNRINL